MTAPEAHALRDGRAHLPLSRINEALVATGDLSRYQRMPKRLEPAREWPYYAITKESK